MEYNNKYREKVFCKNLFSTLFNCFRKKYGVMQAHEAPEITMNTPSSSIHPFPPQAYKAREITVDTPSSSIHYFSSQDLALQNFGLPTTSKSIGPGSDFSLERKGLLDQSNAEWSEILNFGESSTSLNGLDFNNNSLNVWGEISYNYSFGDGIAKIDEQNILSSQNQYHHSEKESYGLPISQQTYEVESTRKEMNFEPRLKRQKFNSCKRCNCKKTECLNQYCVCFATGQYCLDPCNCENCFNKVAFSEKVEVARKMSLLKASTKRRGGCNCKTGCSKEYCICLKNKIGCSVETCKCIACQNIFGQRKGATKEGELQGSEPNMHFRFPIQQPLDNIISSSSINDS